MCSRTLFIVSLSTFLVHVFLAPTPAPKAKDDGKQIPKPKVHEEITVKNKDGVKSVSRIITTSSSYIIGPNGNVTELEGRDNIAKQLLGSDLETLLSPMIPSVFDLSPFFGGEISSGSNKKSAKVKKAKEKKETKE